MRQIAPNPIKITSSRFLTLLVGLLLSQSVLAKEDTHSLSLTVSAEEFQTEVSRAFFGEIPSVSKVNDGPILKQSDLHWRSVQPYPQSNLRKDYRFHYIKLGVVSDKAGNVFARLMLRRAFYDATQTTGGVENLSSNQRVAIFELALFPRESNHQVASREELEAIMKWLVKAIETKYPRYLRRILVVEHGKLSAPRAQIVENLAPRREPFIIEKFDETLLCSRLLNPSAQAVKVHMTIHLDDQNKGPITKDIYAALVGLRSQATQR